jgi:hypothetical protein
LIIVQYFSDKSEISKSRVLLVASSKLNSSGTTFTMKMKPCCFRPTRLRCCDASRCTRLRNGSATGRQASQCLVPLSVRLGLPTYSSSPQPSPEPPPLPPLQPRRRQARRRRPLLPGSVSPCQALAKPSTGARTFAHALPTHASAESCAEVATNPKACSGANPCYIAHL